MPLMASAYCRRLQEACCYYFVTSLLFPGVEDSGNQGIVTKKCSDWTDYPVVTAAEAAEEIGRAISIFSLGAFCFSC